MLKNMLIRILGLFLRRTIEFIFIVLPMILLGVIFLGMYIPFMDMNRKKLPKLLFLWGNFDRDIYGKQNGYKDTRLGRYNWLALRNPANNFQYTVLGADVRQKAKTIITDGGNQKKKVGDGLHERDGWEFTILEGESTRYELYYVKSYRIGSFKRVIRLRLGHKLRHPKRGYLAQWVFSFNPFKRSKRLK